MENPITGDEQPSWVVASSSNAHELSKYLGDTPSGIALSAHASEKNTSISDADYNDVDSLWSESQQNSCMSSPSLSSMQSGELWMSSRESSYDLNVLEDEQLDDDLPLTSHFTGRCYGETEELDLNKLEVELKAQMPLLEGIDDPVQRSEDDTAVISIPTTHVDYLAKDWREGDLWSSWKHVKSKRKAYHNGLRLQNALWRSWGQLRSELATVTPESLNWMKDLDVTWLYGPLQPGPGTGPTKFSSLQHKSDWKPPKQQQINDSIKKKPILKERSMSKILLSRSLVTSSLLKEAAAAEQAQNYGKGAGDNSIRCQFSEPRLGADNIIFPSAESSSSQSSGISSSRGKHIHFNEQVEQYIAVDIRDDDEEPDDERYNYSDSDDDAITMKMVKMKIQMLPVSIPTQKSQITRFGDSKIIALLPPTLLKWCCGDDDEATLAISSKAFWNAGIFSRSSSQETLKPPASSLGIAPGNDDGEDGEDDVGEFLPPPASANWKGSISVIQEGSQDSETSSSQRDEPLSVQRMQSGMLLNMEGRAALDAGRGLWKAVDAIRSVNDLGHLLQIGGSSAAYFSASPNSLTEKLKAVDLSIGTPSGHSKGSLQPVVSELVRYCKVTEMDYRFSGLEELPVLEFGSPVSAPKNVHLRSLAGDKSLMFNFTYQSQTSTLSFPQPLNLDSSEIPGPGHIIHGVLKDPLMNANAVSNNQESNVLSQPTSLEYQFEDITKRLASSTLKSKSDADEAQDISLAFQSSIKLSSSEGSNNSDVENDGYETTTDSYSCDSNATGSSDSMCQGLGSVDEQNPNTRQDLVVSKLGPMRRALVDRVMEEFWIIFNQNWNVGLRECPVASSSSSTSSDPGRSSDLITTSSSLPNQRKRPRKSDETPHDPNDRDSRGPDGSTVRSTGPEERTRLACPFRKHDSQRYNVYTHSVCALSHWETIARVKEHLYRTHRVPVHCKRCWKTFKTQELLDGHLTVATSDICELLPGIPPDGITSEHERRLRSRKKASPNQSNEDRWRDVYKLLFPNEEIPSPYFEPLQEDTPMSPDSRDVASYEDYIRRELPRLVRSNIEEAVRREMQPLEASLISNLVGIVQDCQDKVFRSYRTSQGVGDEAQIPDCDNPLPPALAVSQIEEPPGQNPHQQSDFLGTVFQGPPTHSESPFLSPTLIEIQDVAYGSSRDVLFSDSGYASEQQHPCGCFGPCNCGAPTGNIYDRNTYENSAHQVGTGNTNWDDWAAYSPCDQMGSIGSGFDVQDGNR